MSRTIDIKLSFEQYDMTPGAAGRKFMRNLLLFGGKADARGFHYGRGGSVHAQTFVSVRPVETVALFRVFVMTSVSCVSPASLIF